MNKNLLKIYEGFFDDLDKLNQNQNDGFGEVNSSIYDQHNYILSPDRNPEFFYALCEMCKGIFDNKIGFTQEDLNQIKDIYSNIYGNSCFKNVISLDELQYFHNLKEILPFCFYHCTKLKSVIFPKNLKKFWYSCFSHCTSLEKLNFPDSIKEIYNLSFYYCSSLEEIILPENIKKISNTAFYDCSSLKKIIIPERFKDNMKYIFYEVNLTKVDITY